MRRDVEDVADEFDMPRRFRNEISRLFAQDQSMRSMWEEMDRLMDEFTSPPSLRRRMSRLFDDFGGGRAGALMSGMFVPAIDLCERDEDYSLKVDLPGMREQDIDVRVDADNVLTIQGERHDEKTRNERGYEYTERMHGRFSRSIELPRGVDASKIETDFRNGVLEVRVPKGASQERRIPIGRGRDAGRMSEGGRTEEPRVLAPEGGQRESREAQQRRDEQRRDEQNRAQERQNRS